MFEVDEVKIKAANALTMSKDPEESRQLYIEEIFDWSDYYTENNLANDYSNDSVNKLNAIVDLWIAYATFEISLHQYKKAVDVYDKAINDPIASRSSRIYVAYAEFCVTRSKLANAQNVYIKGLCADIHSQEKNELWVKLLALMHEASGSSDLTIGDLYHAVKSQVDDVSKLTPPYEVVGNNIKTETDSTDMLNSVTRIDNVVQIPPNIIQQQTRHDDNSASVVSMGPPNNISVAPFIDDLDNVTGMTPEMIIKVYTRRPPMIFTAPNKEPMLSGFVGLKEIDRLELETYFGIKLHEFPTIVNYNMTIDNIHEMTIVDKYLDLLEGLWYAQALKERHFESWISDMSNIHYNEEATMMDAYITREPLNTNVKDIRLKYHIDLKRFHNRCAVQKELLHAIVNKTYWAMLLEQQQILTDIKFPLFSQAFVEKIKHYMNNSRVSALNNNNNSNNINNINHEYDVIKDHIAKQRNVVCGVLSIRMNALHEIRTQIHAQSSPKHGDHTAAFDHDHDRKRKRKRVINHNQHSDSYGNSNVSSYSLNIQSPRTYSQNILSNTMSMNTVGANNNMIGNNSSNNNNNNSSMMGMMEMPPQLTLNSNYDSQQQQQMLMFQQQQQLLQQQQQQYGMMFQNN